MIRVEQISKFYDSVQALNNISFEINQGEIVGFLGQNGAGKTTLMRILTGYITPTSGQAFISEMNVQTKPMGIKRKIGYLPETPPLYKSMSVKDYLKLAARLKEVPVNKEKKQIEKVLNECLLMDVENRVIGQLSKGYRQRVGLAQAIINDPDVLILDEPMTGLDPIQNKQIRTLIKNLEQKRTVLLSTHNLSEIESIAKRVIIIKEGEIVVDDSLFNLLKETGAKVKVYVCVRGEKEKIYQVINAMDGPNLLSSDSDGDKHNLVLEFKTHMENYNGLVEKIISTGGEFISLQEETPTLEKVFFRIIDEKDRER